MSGFDDGLRMLPRGLSVLDLSLDCSSGIVDMVEGGDITV